MTYVSLTGNSTAGYIAGINDSYYVGDPLPGHDNQWVKPLTWNSPHTVPTSGIVTITGSNISLWRCTTSTTSIVVSLDIPGVRIEDAVVEIERGLVKFSGKRHDTGEMIASSQFVGQDYDPETATANIDCGVLTVKVDRFKSKLPHKVVIKSR